MNTPNAAASTDVDAARVKHHIETWRERLIDLTKSNPLLGLNRSRVSKLRIVEPGLGSLYDTLVVRGDPLLLPIARQRAYRLGVLRGACGPGLGDGRRHALRGRVATAQHHPVSGPDPTGSQGRPTFPACGAPGIRSPFRRAC